MTFFIALPESCFSDNLCKRAKRLANNSHFFLSMISNHNNHEFGLRFNGRACLVATLCEGERERRSMMHAEFRRDKSSDGQAYSL